MGELRMTVVDERPPLASPADRFRLEQMFAAHHLTVWRTLRRIGLSPDAAADATQQTFLVAAERLDDIHSDSERAFLIGTALRTAHSLRRTTARWQLDEEMDARIAIARDAGDAHADVELCDLALSKVKSDLAEVFVLYEVAGLSSPEIAALLQIPLGSVASRLRRGREQFRAAVARIERSLKGGEP
jgi:RNA polymerase sigma-70 factor, ECF subfamily